MQRYKLTDRNDLNAVLSCIAELDSKKSMLDRQRKAQMQELVLSLVFHEKDAQKTLEALQKIKPRNSFDPEGVNERIAACRQFTSIFGYTDSYKDQFVYKDSVSINEHRLAILENRYTAKAVQIFSNKLQILPNRFNSFDEICEAIAGNSCEYGVLPTESSDDGKLLRFYSLIDRYDLKINAVCDIESSDSGATTRYALVSKVLEYAKSPFGEPDYLEFAVHLENPELIGNIICASSLCSMGLHRIDSMPILYKDKEFSFYLVFKAKHADIETFLLYMHLDFPQYTPIGIFPQL